MRKGKSIILGYGEIGKAVKEVICPDAVVYDISMPDRPKATTPTSIMHICFPYSENFVHDAQAYITIWQAEHIAIWSTLPIGTTKLVDDKVVHTPVESKHPNLALGIQTMKRWVGYSTEAEGDFFRDYFTQLGLTVCLVDSPNFTEALKLLSTTEYGVNIEFARYKKKVADDIGMDFELTKQWNRDYNELYRKLGDGDIYQKFVLNAPEGPKGGHCVTPNARLLHKQYPDSLVKIVGELE